VWIAAPVPTSHSVRDQTLEKRGAKLWRLLARGKGNLVRYRDSFLHAGVLLAECARLGLEGIVSKRKDGALPVGHALGGGSRSRPSNGGRQASTRAKLFNAR
jgi:hypothetical protein